MATREMIHRGRGRHKSELMCRHGCKEVESQSHILQKCYKLKRARIKRHHEVVNLVAERALASGMTVDKEQVVQVSGKRFRPDLILRSGNSIRVVDVTIAYEFSETSLLDAEERKKVSYGVLKDTLLNKYQGSTTFTVEGFVVGARGAWYSGNDSLCKDIGLGIAWKRRLVKSVLGSATFMMNKFDR